MDERIEKWLYDIRFAIEEIESYFDNTEKLFLNFSQNVMLKRAIERNLEIIGEATNRILVQNPKFEISNARKIVNLRNLIIHSYDSISDNIIWAIVINNLPELQKEVDHLIISNMNKTKHLNIIAAVGNNLELGYQNQLLCHLPEDLKRFKTITSGHTVIMGDRTWDSLPRKPLPNRRNIVMTLDRERVFEDCETAHSVEELFAMLNENEEAFIMGGATIYKIFIDMAEKLYLTRILSDFQADVFFPEVDPAKWKMKEDLFIAKDEKNPFDMRFQYYELKK